MQLPAALRLLRPHQWSKNLLAFAPLIFSHQIFVVDLVIQSGLAFVALCLVASSGYIFNDLLDIPSDKKHPTKRVRPLASGAVSPALAIALFAALLCCAILVSLSLPLQFSLAIIGYFFATICYSLWLKYVPVIDVMVLAGLYTVRLYAGSLATSIFISQWLLGISLFTFFSIALAKRYVELRQAKTASGYNTRGYTLDDLPIIGQFGIASGYCATLILMLYFNSTQAQEQYAAPQYLWLLYPLALFWFTRFWLQVHRGKTKDDPLLSVLRDYFTYVVLACAAGILVLAV